MRFAVCILNDGEEVDEDERSIVGPRMTSEAKVGGDGEAEGGRSKEMS